jgi:hypothetical protein
MSSIYKNGEYWYYQTSIEVDGRMKRKQITLKTRDEKVARKRQQIYDRKYEDLKNPFLNTRELFSKTKEEYIDYREKQVKRLVRSQRTLDSDKGVLKSFEDFIKNKYGEIYPVRTRWDFCDHFRCQPKTSKIFFFLPKEEGQDSNRSNGGGRN